MFEANTPNSIFQLREASSGDSSDDARIAKLERELAERATEVEELRGDLSLALTFRAMREEAVAETEQARNEAVTQGTELATQLEAARSSLTEVRVELEQRAAELAGAQQLLAVAADKREKAEAQLAELRSELQVALRERDAIAERLEQVARAIGVPAQETPVEAASAETEIQAPTPADDEEAAAEALDTPIFVPSAGSHNEEFGFAEEPAAQPSSLLSWRNQWLQSAPVTPPLDDGIDFFARPLATLARARVAAGSTDEVQVWSLGGGDLELEARIAQRLSAQGIRNLRIHVIDGTAARRGERTEAVERLECEASVEVFPGPLCNWSLDQPCDAVIADGSLSAVANAPALLEAIARRLPEDGLLVIADRLRLPDPETATEAADLLDRIWQLMPDRYRFDHRRDALRDAFESDLFSLGSADWDERVERLEPALAAHFEPELSLERGHLAWAFLGPALGPNLDPEHPRDTRFLDQVTSLDDARVAAGALPPLYGMQVLRPR